MAILNQDNTFLSAFGIALGIHTILLFLLIITFEFHGPTPGLKAGPQIIQATVLLQPLSTMTPLSTSTDQKKVIKQKIEKKLSAVVQKNNPNQVVIQKQKVLVKKKRQEELKKKNLEKQKLLKQQQQEKNLQQKITEEQTQMNAIYAQEMKGKVDKYKALILQAIGQNWMIPPNTNPLLSADLFIRLAPDGTVLEVRVAHSSGNDALDQSALVAVEKSSPLPVPSDFQAFQLFRELRLTVKPQSVLN